MPRSTSGSDPKAGPRARSRGKARDLPDHPPAGGAEPAGLAEYRRKRDFTRTAEPRGGTPPPRPAGERVFVIQKHAATRLHYDFRLELEGTLKSWAVPKGPSLDPQDKRLAMHVEDHPLEYGSFEGIIPKGEYGGGTVLLWDHGTWRPEGDPHAGYRAGNLKFALEGEKLRGSWALVKIRDRQRGRDGDRSWLLIKHRDAEARPAGTSSITEARPESVATGRTLEEIASAGDRVWHSNRPGRGRAKNEKTPATARPPVPLATDLTSARRAALPKLIAPQLATLVSVAPSGDEWIHELKFDGYRILARLDHGRVRLASRNGKDWTEQFPSVAAAVARVPAEQAMLDGEVAVLLPDGTTSFQALQNVLSDGENGQLVYMVFDLLHLNGHDLTGAPLEERKRVLKQLIAAGGPVVEPVRYSDHVVGAGPEFFAQACRLGVEGIVSKRRNAPYRGTRGQDWLKVKCMKRQEVVIGGYTDPEGARVGIGALLAGTYEDGQLRYAGKVGTGFNERILRDLKKRLDGLAQAACPFEPKPTGVAGAHWVKPELVAEVAFGEWTADGRMRHPSFQGLREDKPARQVVREEPVAITKASEERPPAAPRAAPRARDGSEAAVAGVRITHADRVVYPKLGTTKLDVAHYYEAIADWILPHLVDRPTTLVRCPEGVHKECFYQKHTGVWAPDTIRRVKIPEKTKVGEYLVVDDLPALIGLAQIGILEVHTWNSVAKRLERPDRIVFDLDPAPDVEWARTVEAARLIRDRLVSLKLESFVKTTGGKGLHVVVPLATGTTWETGITFSRVLAEHVVREHPKGYVAHMAKSARTGKIFIDYLRNVRGATSVAAYSTRAKPDATVSVPLDWDELAGRQRPDHYTIKSVPRRLAGLRQDPWHRYWTVRQALPAP